MYVLPDNAQTIVSLSIERTSNSRSPVTIWGWGTEYYKRGIACPHKWRGTLVMKIFPHPD